MDLWSWENYADAGVITSAAGEQPTMPLSNLKDPRIGKLWRSSVAAFAETEVEESILGWLDDAPLIGYFDPIEITEDGAPWQGGEIRVDFGQDRAIGVIGLFNINIADMTQLVFKLGTAPGLGDIWRRNIDIGSLGRRMAVSVIRTAAGVPTTATARHLTVGFAGGARMEAGRLWAGAANWRPEVGHIIGSNFGAIDYSARSATPRTGAFLIDQASRRQVFSASYDAISEAEYLGAMRRMNREVGISGQMLFVPDEDIYPIGEWPILGYLQEVAAVTFTGFLRAERTLNIVEAG